ncbi:SAYSvFN domain-containing protein 1 [Periophthalmus magnuspinnatus]|uniref:SAYSvFN domain-containing protein 1 n=1 Tax=Periophthalmus magnuspinnatus TaxID=409849 RepID=UPI00145BD706|nr:SAYSvFN domain-containing protein 1 [Periophthalmus magnuspinnatus]
MEQKLAEFRARRQAAKSTQKDQNFPQEPEDTADQSTEEQTVKETQVNSTPAQSETNQDKSDWLLDTAVGRWLSSRLAFTNLTLLKLLLWLVLLGLFVELEFGLPFFVLSLFYWIYEGLRSPEARQPGELSAYSVFNPDCQPLLGTLTAEQLEGEMGYRPLANR